MDQIVPDYDYESPNALIQAMIQGDGDTYNQHIATLESKGCQVIQYDTSEYALETDGYPRIVKRWTSSNHWADMAGISRMCVIDVDPDPSPYISPLQPSYMLYRPRRNNAGETLSGIYFFGVRRNVIKIGHLLGLIDEPI